jgi:hypothetical protein
LIKRAEIKTISTQHQEGANVYETFIKVTRTLTVANSHTRSPLLMAREAPEISTEHPDTRYSNLSLSTLHLALIKGPYKLDNEMALV